MEEGCRREETQDTCQLEKVTSLKNEQCKACTLAQGWTRGLDRGSATLVSFSNDSRITIHCVVGLDFGDT